MLEPTLRPMSKKKQRGGPAPVGRAQEGEASSQVVQPMGGSTIDGCARRALLAMGCPKGSWVLVLGVRMHVLAAKLEGRKKRAEG